MIVFKSQASCLRQEHSNKCSHTVLIPIRNIDRIFKIWTGFQRQNRKGNTICNETLVLSAGTEHKPGRRTGQEWDAWASHCGGTGHCTGLSSRNCRGQTSWEILLRNSYFLMKLSQRLLLVVHTRYNTRIKKKIGSAFTCANKSKGLAYDANQHVAFHCQLSYKRGGGNAIVPAYLSV